MKPSLFFILIIGLLSACNLSTGKKQGALLPVLLSDSTRQATCVSLTSDEKNQPVISWCETDRNTKEKKFYLAFFDESRKTFTDRISIPIEQNVNLHEEGMPKIAVRGNGAILAVYETSAPTDSNNFAGFVRYIVSTDKGRTWTQPASLHANTTAGTSHSFAVITRLSDGEIGACWLDQSVDRKVAGRPVKFAKTNQENRFTNELTIDSIACQCCRIAMGSNANGKIYVAFRDILNGSIRDMSVSISDDNGKSFRPALPFSHDGWEINGCPHNGPSVAAGDNAAYAAWFTGGRTQGVYYCELNKDNLAINKQLVSEQGRFVQLCLLSNGTPALAYSESIQDGNEVYSRIVLNKMEQGKVFERAIETGKTMAAYPVIRSFGERGLLVAWKSDEKIYYTIASAADISTAIQRPSPKELPVAKGLSSIKLAGSTDLVCGMPLSLSPGDTTLFQQRVHGFCSQTCKEKFLQNPEAYLSKRK
ncbi:MAG: exo-alpha-sialidase [Chitinophagaceae bacterium]